MKKQYFIFLVVFAIGLFGLSTEIFAADNIIVEPPIGEFVTGTTTTITFRAAPPIDTIDGIELALGITGGTITNVVITDNTEPILGTCDTINLDPAIIFTEDSICFAEYFNPYLTQNQLLFTATVLWGDPGTASIIHTGSMYMSTTPSATFDLTGEVGSYTIVLELEPTNTPIPNVSVTPTGALPPTGIIDENINLILGVGLVFTGIGVYRYSGNKYLSNLSDYEN
jgi:hypothetical protein